MSLKYNESAGSRVSELFQADGREVWHWRMMSVCLRFPRYPEVFTMEEQAVDEEELWKGLKKALDGAVTAVC